MNSINEIAEQVIFMLKDKVIIHRYNSYSTNSVYLKFDFGVANSLRISDHNGKKHLSYRYNIIVNSKEKQTSNINGYDMYFYPPTMIVDCVNEILKNKQEKLGKYTNYEAVIKKAKQDIKNQKGFWTGAKQIN